MALLSEFKEGVIFPNFLKKLFFLLLGPGQCLLSFCKFFLQGRQCFHLRNKEFTVNECGSNILQQRPVREQVAECKQKTHR